MQGPGPGGAALGAGGLLLRLARGLGLGWALRCYPGCEAGAARGAAVRSSGSPAAKQGGQASLQPSPRPSSPGLPSNCVGASAGHSAQHLGGGTGRAHKDPSPSCPVGENGGTPALGRSKARHGGPYGVAARPGKATSGSDRGHVPLWGCQSPGLALWAAPWHQCCLPACLGSRYRRRRRPPPQREGPSAGTWLPAASNEGRHGLRGSGALGKLVFRRPSFEVKHVVGLTKGAERKPWGSCWAGSGDGLPRTGTRGAGAAGSGSNRIRRASGGRRSHPTCSTLASR